MFACFLNFLTYFFFPSYFPCSFADLTVYIFENRYILFWANCFGMKCDSKKSRCFCAVQYGIVCQCRRRMSTTESIQIARGVEVARSLHHVIQRNRRANHSEQWKKLMVSRLKCGHVTEEKLWLCLSAVITRATGVYSQHGPCQLLVALIKLVTCIVTAHCVCTAFCLG